MNVDVTWIVPSQTWYSGLVLRPVDQREEKVVVLKTLVSQMSCEKQVTVWITTMLSLLNCSPSSLL